MSNIKHKGTNGGKFESPKIIIHDKSEISLYFPSADVQKFHRAGQGEWHGPCPFCGGKDRFLISNGYGRCRQNDHFGGRNGTKNAVWLASLRDDLPKPTAEQIAEWRHKEKEEARLKQLEQHKAIKELTKSKSWEAYHQHLIQNPDRISEVQAMWGFDRRHIDHFEIGFNPQFIFWNGETQQHEYTTAFTFPLKRQMVIEGISGKWTVNIRHRLLRSDLPKGYRYRPYKSGLPNDYLRANFPGSKWGVILEGEAKAITMWGFGIPAIGIAGFETFQSKWIPEIKRMWPEGIFICLDREADDHPDKERIWDKAVHMANKLGGIAIMLPIVGKPDDLLLQNKLSVAQFIGLLQQQPDKKLVIE